MADAGPRAEYERRRDLARAEVARRGALASRLSNLRLLVFGALGVVAWLVFGSRSLASGWLAPGALTFGALVVLHDRVLRVRERAQRVLDFYEGGLARLEDRWPGSGESGAAFADPQHPYAADLDLFGEGSLFELLCTARSHAGQRLLADWLLQAAAPDAIRARQAALAELRPQLGLREDLATLAADVASGVHPEVLSRWGEAPVRLGSRAAHAVALVLPLLSLAGLVSWLSGAAAPLWFAVVLAVQGGFAWGLRARVQQAIAGVDEAGRELALLAELLGRLELERFQAPLLAELRGALDTHGVAPSRRIRALRTRIDLLDARRNQLFAPLAALLLWTTNLAFGLERWRAECGGALGRWIQVLGEFEALASLAGYAYENPERPFAEIVPEGPCLEGEALGHPLLPRERCVPNDVRLAAEPALLVVSGSNMSGKSTLLRTVGVNAVLALAGAPVRARKLTLSPLAVGATLRIQDSLQAGRSRFYAEITRVSRLVQLAGAGPLPLLFLLDELLSGTNSHDRRLGAEAILRGLLDRGAFGLITTHDLALAEIADRLAPRAVNVHFEDHLENGRLTFDYRMRPGVVQKSNALALMRAVGLEV